MLDFSNSDWRELSDTIINWDTIILKISSKLLVQKLEKVNLFISQDATTRYLDFLQKYPNLVNHIPLSHIASYLGITQQSLSRKRKKSR